jgi:hypothetical protein
VKLTTKDTKGTKVETSRTRKYITSGRQGKGPGAKGLRLLAGGRDWRILLENRRGTGTQGRMERAHEPLVRGSWSDVHVYMSVSTILAERVHIIRFLCPGRTTLIAGGQAEYSRTMSTPVFARPSSAVGSPRLVPARMSSMGACCDRAAFAGECRRRCEPAGRRAG